MPRGRELEKRPAAGTEKLCILEKVDFIPYIVTKTHTYVPRVRSIYICRVMDGGHVRNLKRKGRRSSPHQPPLERPFDYGHA